MERIRAREYNFRRRRPAMSPRNLSLFTLVAAIVVFGAAGPLTVQIKEYEVPAPKSRPHDPALAPDGSLWDTGQGATKLGRRAPKTGKLREYPLPPPNSWPHALAPDKERSNWVTPNL